MSQTAKFNENVVFPQWSCRLTARDQEKIQQKSR